MFRRYIALTLVALVSCPAFAESTQWKLHSESGKGLGKYYLFTGKNSDNKTFKIVCFPEYKNLLLMEYVFKPDYVNITKKQTQAADELSYTIDNHPTKKIPSVSSANKITMFLNQLSDKTSVEPKESPLENMNLKLVKGILNSKRSFALEAKESKSIFTIEPSTRASIEAIANRCDVALSE